MPDIIDENMVRHVATLARLKLSDAEVARFVDELSAILGYIDQLNEVDTSDVAPTFHALPVVNVLREDELGESLPVAAALANAPDRWGDFFRVPRVLDQQRARQTEPRP